MTDLKLLYRQAIIGRVAELESGLAAAENGDESATDGLRRVAHSLRGSGATYGFPEVTDAAASVEDAPAATILVHTRTLLRVLHAVIEGAPRPGRVLIVDDDPEILLLLKTVLAGAADLATAANGAEAIEQLDGRPYTLVILDLLLPDTDGREVLKHVRGHRAYGNLPVIVLSAKTATATRAECEALGATAFFEKPFDPEAVAAAVRAQLVRLSQNETEAQT